jgi:tRNA(adenine34) deaminase
VTECKRVSPPPTLRAADPCSIVVSPAPCYNIAVDDAAWMRKALTEAEQALAHGDVPVGAVAVREGIIVGRGHNCKEVNADPTAHAEMLALREAAHTLGGWRLVEVTLYCTLEPCPMCAGAMVSARLPRLVYGAIDPKAGAAGSVVELLRDPRLNHQVAVTSGVLAEKSQALLERFFTELRSNREKA